MLTEERYKIILDIINEKDIVTVGELVSLLDTSESTIRRDLNSLHKIGKVKKLRGGATKVLQNFQPVEKSTKAKKELNIEDKKKIGKYAAKIIEKGDFVYIDAGTTTELMIPYIENRDAIFITNGINHAKKLIENNCKVYILGGELKITTEAIVGAEAVNTLRKYNFTKCFLGTNGISIERGFTTPDIKEALLKEEVINRSKEVFVLSDNSKFGVVSSITFGEINQGTIITTNLLDKSYEEYTKIMEV